MPVHTTTTATVITGKAIGGYRALVIAKAIELYLSTGMKANRAYTPTRMREAASQFTGKQYPRSRKGLGQACVDLLALIDSCADLDAVGEREQR